MESLYDVIRSYLLLAEQKDSFVSSVRELLRRRRIDLDFEIHFSLFLALADPDFEDSVRKNLDELTGLLIEYGLTCRFQQENDYAFSKLIVGTWPLEASQQATSELLSKCRHRSRRDSLIGTLFWMWSWLGPERRDGILEVIHGLRNASSRIARSSLREIEQWAASELKFKEEQRSELALLIKSSQ